MQQRLNISLPRETVRLLDRVGKRGNRSRLIDAAVRHFVTTLGQKTLRQQLAEGYRALGDSSLEIAAEWFPADEEAWRKVGL